MRVMPIVQVDVILKEEENVIVLATLVTASALQGETLTHVWRAIQTVQVIVQFEEAGNVTALAKLDSDLPQVIHASHAIRTVLVGAQVKEVGNVIALVNPVLDSPLLGARHIHAWLVIQTVQADVVPKEEANVTTFAIVDTV